MSESLGKEIDRLRDAKTHLWAAILGTFGGTFGFMFSNAVLIIKVPVVAAGLILSLIFLENYLRKDNKIKTIIKFLSKHGELKNAHK